MASFLVVTHGFLSLEMSSGVALLLFNSSILGVRGEMLYIVMVANSVFSKKLASFLVIRYEEGHEEP